MKKKKMMGLLYNVESNTVTRNFRVTASDGKLYNTKHFNLKVIISVGNKVDSLRAVQFRKWANDISSGKGVYLS